MAKYGNSYYMQVTRKLFKEPYSELSQNAKWLYIVLKELEQRYCGGNDSSDFFIRSDEQLCEDSQLSLSTLKRAKKELCKTDLIETWQSHWIDNKSKKMSQKHITAYRINNI